MRVKWNRNLDGMPISADANANEDSLTDDGSTTTNASSSIVSFTEPKMGIKTAARRSSSSSTSSASKRDANEEDRRSLNKLANNFLNLFRFSNNQQPGHKCYVSDLSRQKSNTSNEYFHHPSSHLFTTDSKRRRRANNLILRNSAIRRSWHQLCTQNQKFPIVNSPPATPQFYRNGKSSSLRSYSPTETFVPSFKQSEENRVDVATAAIEQPPSSIDSAVDVDMQSDEQFVEGDRPLKVSSKHFNPIPSNNCIELNRDSNSSSNTDNKLVPNFEARSNIESKWSTNVSLSDANGPLSTPVGTAFADTTLAASAPNNTITYHNQISFNLYLDQNRLCLNENRENDKNDEFYGNECFLQCEETKANTANTVIKSSFTSSASLTNSRSPTSEANPTPTITTEEEEEEKRESFAQIHSSEQQTFDAGNDAIGLSEKDEVYLRGADVFSMRKEDKHLYMAEPVNTNEVVKVTVKKALVPEIVNISQKNGETSITPLVKFEDDEPVTIRNSAMGQQSSGKQGILKDRSNGNVIGTNFKSAIPKKVHFAETTKMRAKHIIISNHLKANKRLASSNDNNTASTNNSTVTSMTTTTTSSNIETSSSGLSSISTSNVVELKKNAISTDEEKEAQEVENNETSLALTSLIESEFLPLTKEQSHDQLQEIQQLHTPSQSSIKSEEIVSNTMQVANSKSTTSSVNAKATVVKTRSVLPKSTLPSPSIPKAISGSTPARAISSSSTASSRVGTASARAATTLLSLQKEIDKYRKLSETQKKQLTLAKREMSRTSIVAQGLACVIKYLNEDLDAFSNPIIRREIKAANRKYTEYELSLQEKQNTIDNLLHIQCELEDEIKRWNMELEREKTRQKKEKDKLLEMFECEKKALESKYSLNLQTENHKKSELQKRIQELKHELEEKVQDVETFKKRIQEIEASLLGDKDKRVRTLNEKVKYLSEEVKSLKAVLEIKEEEVKNLSHKLRITEQKSEELPTLQQTVMVLNQKLEQLEISVNQKNEAIAKLMRENEGLKQQFENETKLRRRISMKNEELEFALSESVCGSLDAPFHKSAIRSNESTPIRMMSRSMYDGWNNFDTETRSNKRLRSFDKMEESGRSNESSSTSSSSKSFSKTFINCSTEEFDDEAKPLSKSMSKTKSYESYEEKREISVSTLPKCILDSGFEEIQGLNNNK
ncbi:hypothetical protein B4U79_08603 [Dinothrombium tinctorium]|uniref:Uncharacterized protein n=1 Tax=Dinothrombium tinctorium TaxID=1965070 RepID=A0A3S3PHZ7_9ACAR|nr:hypothetical protein B4U79_08603 [Dinothrombium tinctorium]